MPKHPDWDAVRAAVTGTGEILYRRVAETITETNEATGEETTREVVRYKAVPPQEAKDSFARIEADVDRLVQEFASMQMAERELRNALEADGAPGAEVQRRG